MAKSWGTFLKVVNRSGSSIAATWPAEFPVNKPNAALGHTTTVNVFLISEWGWERVRVTEIERVRHRERERERGRECSKRKGRWGQLQLLNYFSFRIISSFSLSAFCFSRLCFSLLPSVSFSFSLPPIYIFSCRPPFVSTLNIPLLSLPYLTLCSHMGLFRQHRCTTPECQRKALPLGACNNREIKNTKNMLSVALAPLGCGWIGDTWEKNHW